MIKKFQYWYHEPITIPRYPTSLTIDPENAIWLIFAGIAEQLNCTSSLNHHLTNMYLALYPIYTIIVNREIDTYQQYTRHNTPPLSLASEPKSMFVCGICTTYLVNFVTVLQTPRKMYLCTRCVLQLLKGNVLNKNKKKHLHITWNDTYAWSFNPIKYGTT